MTIFSAFALYHALNTRYVVHATPLLVAKKHDTWSG
jgi:hypothetical protein